MFRDSTSDRRLSALGMLVAAISLVGLIGAQPALAACTVVAGWGNNCLTSRTSHAISDLTVAIQTDINADGLSGNTGTIDGNFGPITEGAVEDFQTAVGITSDGIVGSNTWNNLRGQLVFWTITGPYRYYTLPALPGSYPNRDGKDVAFRQRISNSVWQVYSMYAHSWVTIDSTRTS